MSVWFFYAAFPFLSPSHEVRERPRVGAYGAGEATDGWGPWRWDPHVGVERAGLERLGSGSNVHRGRRALRRSRDRSLARSPPDESAARRCGLLLLATAWPPAAAAMWGPTVSLHATQTQAAGGAFAMRPTVDSSIACL